MNTEEVEQKKAVYRSLVSPSMMDDLEKRIRDKIVTQKKYLDKGYSAKKLAEDLGTNTRYISAVVNVRFHMNYTSFVNLHRIKEAMELMVMPKYQKLNMEELSDMVGFSNRQSFYAAFTKVVGTTPRSYKVANAVEPGKRGRYRKVRLDELTPKTDTIGAK
ncbi:MAG: helix-turn-helix domain-containing protein [Prevotella sp.]|jgi:AraC-like DNA-binding protein